MIPPPEQIVLAIQHLHAHPTESQEVNRQLMELQRMPDAWSICLPLLEHPHDINVQFFGAQTLQVKIVNDWYNAYITAYQDHIVGIQWAIRRRLNLC